MRYSAVLALVLVLTSSGCLGLQSVDESALPEDRLERGDAPPLNTTATLPAQNSTANLTAACHREAMTMVTERLRTANGQTPGSIYVENPNEVIPNLIIERLVVVGNDGQIVQTPNNEFTETVARTPRSVQVNVTTTSNTRHRCELEVFVERQVVIRGR